MSKSKEMKPMLAAVGPRGALLQTSLSMPGWSYELKLDGVRILADKQGKSVLLRYRSGRDATREYPEIVESMRELTEEDLCLDGEVLALGADGMPSFGLLQQRMHLQNTIDVARMRSVVPVVYVVFDILRRGGIDLCDRTLVERRAALRDAIADRGLIRMFDAHDDGNALFAFCKQRGLEGVMAKRLASSYQPGTRSPDWLKIKCQLSNEFVVVGYTRGDSGAGSFGALDLATYDSGRWIARGKVGSGFDQKTLAALKRELDAITIEACVAEGTMGAAKGGRVFVEPKIVVSVTYAGWTADGKLRMPVFRGRRTDVAPEDCDSSPGEDR